MKAKVSAALKYRPASASPVFVNDGAAAVPSDNSNIPARANFELATVACGVKVKCVTYVPALAISLPNVITPPSATFSFHSSPASSPLSAINVIANPAPSFAAIFNESVVASS